MTISTLRLLMALGLLCLNISNNLASNWIHHSDSLIIYKVNKQEIKYIQTNTSNFDSIFFTKLPFSKIPYTEDDHEAMNRMPVLGNFALVSLKQNNVKITLHSNLDFNVYLIEYREKPALIIRNVLGENHPNMKVTTDLDSLQIDSTCMCYPIKKSIFNQSIYAASAVGILEQKVNELEPLNGTNKSYYHHGVFYTLFHPNKDYYPSNNTSGYDSGRLPGFIVTSKPKYRIGEKIQLKAFIFNDLNKPYQNNVLVEFYQNNKLLATKEIEAKSQGAYVTDFLLGDSLRLNSQVSILIKDKILKKVLRSTRVLVEDYKLPDCSITISMPTTQINKNHPARVAISAHDFNNFPLLNATVDLAVIVQFGYSYYNPKSITLPDTLYHINQKLSNTGIGLFEIPDSVFKASYLSAQCIVSVNSAQFERNTQTFHINYSPNLPHLEMYTTKDSLHLIGSDTSVKTAELYFQNHLIHINKTVSLPHHEKLQGDFELIEASSLEYKTSIQQYSYRPQVEFNVTFKEKKVNINLENPRNTNVLIELFQNNKYIKTHSGKTFNYEGYIDEFNPIYVYYSYMLNGVLKRDVRTIQYRDKQLAITAYFPETSFPGQKLESTIVVRDMNDDLMPFVNLTAYATNNQFGEVSMPSLPYLGNLNTPAKFEMNFGMKNMHYDLHFSSLTPNWLKLFETDSNMYYKFLLFNEKSKFHSIPLQNKHFTYLSVHVMNGFQQIEPTLIYVDNKLVWSKFNSSHFKSVIVSAGKHTIEVRLAEKIIKNQLVNLKDNQLNYLVLRNENFEIDNIDVFAAEPQLSPEELKLIQHTHIKKQGYSYALALTQNAYFQRLSWSYNNVIGPLNPSEPIRLIYEEELPIEFSIDSLSKTTINKPYSQTFQYYKVEDNHLKNTVINYHFSEATAEESDAPFRIGHYQFPYLLTATNPLQTNTGNAELVLVPCGYKSNIRYLSIKSLTDKSENRIHHSFKQYFYNLKPGSYEISISDGVQIKHDTLILHPNKRTYWVFKMPYKNYAEFTQKQKKQTIVNQLDSIDNGGKISGVVFDEKTRDALPFVNVILLKDNKQMAGTATDFDGKFCFKWIPAGSYNLKVTYTGYKNQQIVKVIVEQSKTTFLSLALDQQMLDISEFEIIDYTVPLIAIDNSVQGGTVTREDIKNLAAVTAAAHASKVGGVYTVGNQIDELNIRGSRDEADYYFIDGIKVRSANLPRTSLNQLQRLTGGIPGQYGDLNSSLIQVDESPTRIGKRAIAAKAIRNNFSDVGFWVPDMVTNDRGRANFTATLPDNITSWNAKILAVSYEGGSGTFSQNIYAFKPLFTKVYGPRFAIAGDSITHYATAVNYTGINQKINVCGDYDGNSVLYDSYTLTSDLQEELGYRIAADATKVNFEFNLQLQPVLQYTDGEQIELPVYPKGVLIDTGMFVYTSHDTTFNYNTSVEGEVTIHVMPQISSLMDEEIHYLNNYSHLCNEQASSKLLAVLADQIRTETKGEKFAHKSDATVLIRRLLDGKNEAKLWGWWKGTATVNWITMQVIKALDLSQKMGYDVPGYSEIADELEHVFESMHTADQLVFLPAMIAAHPKANFDKYLKEFSKIELDCMEQKLELEYIKAMLGKPVALDSIKKWAEYSFDSLPSWRCKEHPYHNNFKPTFLVLKILNVLQTDNAFRDKVLFSLLKLRSNSHWLNTKQSADMLLEISKITTNYFAEAAVNVTVNGKSYSVQNKPQKIVVTSPKTTIKVKANQLIFISVSQNKWQAEVNQKKTSNFEITSNLIQAKSKQNVLKVGIPAVLRVNLKAANWEEYVMVEIPIPAGCEVEKEKCTAAYNETYREYARDKVSIYYQRLSAGSCTIEIPLQVRFKGEYTLNPVLVEAMYSPTFKAYEATKTVIIK